MKTWLAAPAMSAALLTVLFTWAVAQPPREEPPWEGPLWGAPRPQPVLIDDVDREAQKKAPTRQRPPRIHERGRAHAVKEVDSGTNRLTLIDDVDRDAQKRAAMQRALKAMDRGPVGRYAVSACDKRALLVDTVTGKTWILCPSGTARPSGVVWMPVERIDDAEALRRKPRREESRDNAAEDKQSKR